MAEPFIGEIQMFGGTFAPRGWAFCNGQLLPVSQNDALFSLLGTIYGGDGRTTFALPDLRSRVPIHQGQGPGLSSRTIGQRLGAERDTLTINTMPSHAHTMQASANPATLTSPAGSVLAESTPGTTMYDANDQIDATLYSGVVSYTGGGQSHNNIMPYLAVNFIIALVGIYPSRT